MEAKENNALLKFAKNHLKTNTYISSRNLALVYDKCGGRGKPNRSLMWKFSRILGILRDDGLIEKFNTRVHKKKLNSIPIDSNQ